MRAAVITAPGGPDVLSIVTRPRPEPGAGEILVRVMASALNRADLMQRAGRYPAPAGVPADIPGLEFAGVVESAGPGALLHAPGQRVMGLVGGGAHAEYLITHERAVAPVPLSVPWTVAGAAPEACITAYDALRQAAVRPGDTVLIHAVGSGVGLVAVQLARLLGARVLGTARGEAKLQAARALGLDEGIVMGDDVVLAERVRALTDGRGVDVVLDLVGGDYVRDTLPAMALRGRIVLIGTLAGASTTVDLRTILTRRLTVTGTVLRSRPLEERIAVTQQFAREVVPWLERGALQIPIETVLPLERIAEGHAQLERNASAGKIALDFSHAGVSV
jgi:putative PIG3 family NAD(P)H quinone oxidoreductase